MKVEPFENERTLAGYRDEDDEETFHRAYDEALADVRADLGGRHPMLIGGEAIHTDETHTVTSPGDTELVIGEFAAAGSDEVDRAVAAAREAFDDWRRRPHVERAGVTQRAARIARDRKFRLAATITLENGKSRREAMADVDEAIDFLRFYARELERHDGYVYDTGTGEPGEDCENVLRPYGVFGVIAPFNFPLAILTGMTAGAILPGNTAVVKPATATPLIAHECYRILEAADLPDGVVNLVTGRGSGAGQPIVGHEDVAGVAFTGSRAVGREIQRTAVETDKPGPVVAELGGKNPVVVAADADLEKAVPGVLAGAFSFAGQKCSATSRVYVHEDRYDAFVEDLVARTREVEVGPPAEPGALVSPLIDDRAVERYREVVERARADGTVEVGGEVLDVDRPGRYVAPTVVTGIDHDHPLAREEHFIPVVTLHPVADLDEGIERSNDSDYGLCAGLFAEDDRRIDRWLDRIESGMCYVNRSASATTGALVGAQPFGGWKGSGTTGKFAGGRWYLPQFAREQSRTVVREE